MTTNNLWPDFQAPEAIQSPVYLLKEQAAGLAEKTRGLVRAGLRPASLDGNFWVGFDLYSPALGEYTFRLFSVTYPPQFFPVDIDLAGESRRATTLEELRSQVSDILRSPRTRQVVEAIMAQATALGPVGAEA